MNTADVPLRTYHEREMFPIMYWIHEYPWAVPNINPLENQPNE
jgi:hypothetical protein